MSNTARRRRRVLVSSGSAQWTPLELPGIAAWWDFSDISRLYQDDARTVPVVADGDVIGGVASKYGTTHASQGTTAKKPIYRAGVQGGKSVARLDGGDDWLGVSVASVVSAIIVYRRTGLAATEFQNFIYGSNDWMYPSISSSGSHNKWYLNSGYRSGSRAPDTNWHINTYILTSASAKVLTDGTLDLSYTAALTGGNITYIGAWGGTQRWANGDIGEIILSTTDITPSLASATAYLQAKWGI